MLLWELKALQNLVGAALHVGQRAFDGLRVGEGCGGLLADDELDAITEFIYTL